MRIFTEDFEAMVRANRVPVEQGPSLDYYTLRNRRYSLRLEALSEHRDPIMPPWAKAILIKVCRKHGLDHRLVAGNSQTKRVVACRDEVVLALRNDRRKPSVTLIGRWFAKDHTIVHYAMKRDERRAA